MTKRQRTSGVRIGHIAYRCKPAVGGLENYVDQLSSILADAGYTQHIYQVNTGVVGDEFLFVPRLPLLPKQVSYNIGLLARVRDLAQEDRLIINNPEHYLPVAWHKGTIVLCHGATWTADNSPRRRRLRLQAAGMAFRGAKQWVFNDTFAMRELGIDQAPQTGMFQEVAPGKWFIPNCVDDTRFCPGPGLESLRGLNPILVPRNLTKPRGVDIAIRSFAMMLAHFPDTNLVVVGDIIYDNLGSFAYKQDLNRLVAELGLVGRVFFLGSVPPETMPAIYNSALVTLIPTRCSEGTSLAALESMACGTPVVSTDVEGLLDLPTVHASPVPESMADAVASVLSDRDNQGQKQREEVLNTYNLDNWRKAWLAVIGQT